ncbi:polyprenyl diphosphate synthase [Amnibacterium endophyticum]|uniref:Isoprenyl transferase n=1 Tax=Amnibacterium endophyticum TaxID=2109337 RepID=A0ABW4LDL9_9MICO
MRIPGVRLRRPVYSLYQRRLRRNLAGAPLPRHVAMILDGNRRWARLAGLQSVAHGHRAGADRLLEFADWVDRVGIRHVTFYLLSTDNLRGRTGGELTDLFDIIGALALDLSSRWRVQHVGTREGLPAALLEDLEEAERRGAAHDDGLHINLAVGYGGRTEIVHAMRSIVRGHAAGGGGLEDLAETLTPELIGEHLWTGGQPDPDLVIRTSGEQRLSDFMLWQSAHSEFYFVEALGPDLREVDLLRALRSYVQRQRRYGG